MLNIRNIDPDVFSFLFIGMGALSSQSGPCLQLAGYYREGFGRVVKPDEGLAKFWKGEAERPSFLDLAGERAVRSSEQRREQILLAARALISVVHNFAGCFGVDEEGIVGTQKDYLEAIDLFVEDRLGVSGYSQRFGVIRQSVEESDAARGAEDQNPLSCDRVLREDLNKRKAELGEAAAAVRDYVSESPFFLKGQARDAARDFCIDNRLLRRTPTRRREFVRLGEGKVLLVI